MLRRGRSQAAAQPRRPHSLRGKHAGARRLSSRRHHHHARRQNDRGAQHRRGRPHHPRRRHRPRAAHLQALGHPRILHAHRRGHHGARPSPRGTFHQRRKNGATPSSPPAKSTGELVWPLPIDDEFRENVLSEIATAKNTSFREGSACSSASFVKLWAEETPFVHFDIAGTAWTTKPPAHLEGGATGFGIRLTLAALRAGLPV